jgi:hypothetical protein
MFRIQLFFTLASLLSSIALADSWTVLSYNQALDEARSQCGYRFINTIEPEAEYYHFDSTKPNPDMWDWSVLGGKDGRKRGQSECSIAQSLMREPRLKSGQWVCVITDTFGIAMSTATSNSPGGPNTKNELTRAEFAVLAHCPSSENGNYSRYRACTSMVKSPVCFQK